MKIEAVLLFDDDDFEAQTGVKKEEDIEFDDTEKPKKGEGLASPEDNVSQSEASYAEESSTRR